MRLVQAHVRQSFVAKEPRFIRLFDDRHSFLPKELFVVCVFPIWPKEMLKAANAPVFVQLVEGGAG